MAARSHRSASATSSPDTSSSTPSPLTSCPVGEEEVAEEPATWVEGVQAYLGIQWAPLPGGDAPASPPTANVAGVDQDTGQAVDISFLPGATTGKTELAGDGLTSQWVQVDEAITETRATWANTAAAATASHQKKVDTLGVGLDLQQTTVAELQAALGAAEPESKRATLLAQELVAAEKDREATRKEREKLQLDLHSMASLTELQGRASTLQQQRQQLKGQLETATAEELPALKAAERRLRDDEAVLKVALQAAQPSLEPGVSPDAMLQRAMDRREKLAAKEGETPEQTAQRRALALDEQAAPTLDPQSAKVLSLKATTHENKWDLLGDDPSHSRTTTRTELDDGVKKTETGSTKLSLKDASVTRSKSTAIEVEDGGSTNRTTSGTVGIKDGLSFAGSDEQTGTLPDGSTTSTKTSANAKFSEKGGELGMNRSTSHQASPTGPTSSSNTGVTAKWDEKNKQVGVAHERKVTNADGSNGSFAGNAALVSGEDGNGIKLSGQGGGTHGDASTGGTVSANQKTDLLLTDRKVGYGSETSVKTGGAGTPKAESKVSHSGSYQADIFKDPKSGLYKLKVTLTLAGGVSNSIESGDDKATDPDSKRYGNRPKGKGAGSVDGGITITKTRLLTAEEKAAYLTELEKADADGKTRSNKPEIKALARATAGLKEVGRLANVVGDPSVAANLAEGEELEISIKAGVGLSGGAGGIDVGAKGSLSRTVKMSRGKAEVVTLPDGTTRKKQPVNVTLIFGASGEVNGAGALEAGAGTAKANLSRSASRAEGKTVQIDASHQDYSGQMKRVMAAKTPEALAALAKSEDGIVLAGFESKSADKFAGGVEGEILKGAAGLGVSQQDHKEVSIKADLLNKSLKDSSVSGGSGGEAKVSALGVELKGGSKAEVNAKIGDDGIEGTLEKEETSGLSALGGLIAMREQILTAYEFDDQTLAALVGRASQKQRWNGFTSDHRLLGPWQRLGRELRSPRVDPALQKVNATEARALARAEALADYMRAADVKGLELMARCMNDWEGASDIGVKTQFSKEESSLFGSKDTTEGLTRKEWQALKKAHGEAMKLERGSEGVAALVASFEKLATAADAKLSSGELDPRARAEMRDQIMRWRNELDGHGTKERTSSFLGPTVEAAEAEVEKQARAARELDRLDALVAGFRPDEVRHLENVANELDDRYYYSNLDVVAALVPVNKLHDEWSTHMDALEDQLEAVGRTREQIDRRLKVRGPRKDWVAKVDGATYADVDERMRVAGELHAWLDRQ